MADDNGSQAAMIGQAQGVNQNLAKIAQNLSTLAVGASQNVVTASRVLGNTYQNTTTKAISVNVVVQNTIAGTISVYTDANASPATLVWQHTVSVVTVTASFMVQAGSYFKVSATGTNSIVQWVEWR
jgi:hypothetical protein